MAMPSIEFIEGLKRRGADIPDPCGIWGLHASAVVAPGGALVFLGTNGAGKSTIRRLLTPSFRPLADDAVYLIPAHDGSWSVADAGYPQPLQPLSEGEAARLRGVPLQAAFTLAKGDGVRLEGLDALSACRQLLNGLFEITRQNAFAPDVRRRSFADVAAIARRYPAYRLVFDLSGRVVDLMVHHFGTDQQGQALETTRPVLAESCRGPMDDWGLPQQLTIIKEGGVS
jgi:hypothetical protein